MVLLTALSSVLTWGPALWGWLISPDQARWFTSHFAGLLIVTAVLAGLTGFCLAGVTLYRRDWRGIIGFGMVSVTWMFPIWIQFFPDP